MTPPTQYLIRQYVICKEAFSANRRHRSTRLPWPGHGPPGPRPGSLPPVSPARCGWPSRQLLSDRESSVARSSFRSVLNSGVEWIGSLVGMIRRTGSGFDPIADAKGVSRSGSLRHGRSAAWRKPRGGKYLWLRLRRRPTARVCTPVDPEQRCVDVTQHRRGRNHLHPAECDRDL